MTEYGHPTTISRIARIAFQAATATLALGGIALGLVGAGSGADAERRVTPIATVGSTAAGAPTPTACDPSDEVDGFVRDGVAGVFYPCTGAFTPFTPTPTPTPTPSPTALTDPPTATPAAASVPPPSPAPPTRTPVPPPTLAPTETPHVHI